MKCRIDQSLVPYEVGWNESGMQVPIVCPNYGDDEEETETPLETAADMLTRLIGMIVPADGPIRLDLIGQKFLAIHYLLNRSGTQTLSALASRAGLSKQIFSHHIQKIGDEIGFRAMGQKRNSTRSTYAQAQQKVWAGLTPEQRKARSKGAKKQTRRPTLI
jgi:hypothetical protein